MKRILGAALIMTAVACSPGASDPVTSIESLAETTSPGDQAEQARKLSAKDAASVRVYLVLVESGCEVMVQREQLARRGVAVAGDRLEPSTEFKELAARLDGFPGALAALKAVRGHERTCFEHGSPADLAKLVAAKSELLTELELITYVEPGLERRERSVAELEEEVARARAIAIDGDAVSEAVLAAAEQDLADARRRSAQE